MVSKLAFSALPGCAFAIPSDKVSLGGTHNCPREEDQLDLSSSKGTKKTAFSVQPNRNWPTSPPFCSARCRLAVSTEEGTLNCAASPLPSSLLYRPYHTVSFSYLSLPPPPFVLPCILFHLFGHLRQTALVQAGLVMFSLSAT